MLLDDFDRLGGQLVKQTHMFFGSQEQFAGSRGIDIADQLAADLKENDRVRIMSETTALGIYEDGVLLVEQAERIQKIRAERLIIAVGASERMLAFPNNDLPGVYGAGAAQTLMNVHGVRPGQRVLMVGAGNIGLIVAYQMLQAGVEVVGIVEAAPAIGGYWVHAAKVRRAGVPIYTSHTVKQACGHEAVTGAVLWNWMLNGNPLQVRKRK